MATIVVTGASSGIGHAAVQRFAKAGHTVFAGVRKQADADDLTRTIPGNVVPLLVDVTDPAAVEAAAQAVAEQVGAAGLDGLVNNAGVGMGGALEHMPIDDLRRQLEINLVAQLAVTQAFLPLIRKATGRIVFTGSIAGRISMPMLGPYSASKAGLTALAESLQEELRPWGIRVSVIEPGAIQSSIWDKTTHQADEIRATLTPEQREQYAAHLTLPDRFVAHSVKIAIPADRVARAMEKALFSRWPRMRYPVGMDAKSGAFASRLLPNGLKAKVTTSFADMTLPRTLD